MIEISGSQLTITDIKNIVDSKSQILISEKAKELVGQSCAVLDEAIKKNIQVYGVTTNFGGLANQKVDDYEKLQHNLILGLKIGIGKKLDNAHIKLAMLIRLNSLAQGCSAIRLELLERLRTFINNNVYPFIYDQGSIGASGDLIPLSYIAGCVTGLRSDYNVSYQGQKISCLEALAKFNMKPIKLKVKEGLAMVNGTSVSTAIALNSYIKFKNILKLLIVSNSLFFISLKADTESLNSFIHDRKRHPGQIKAASILRSLLKDYQHELIEERLEKNELLQDRYSLRCIAQYLGIIYEGMDSIESSLLIESNSVTDNPIINAKSKEILHGGNFLSEHVSVMMDHMRGYIALAAKHMDIQAALLLSPEFNKGLPASLVPPNITNSFGLKGLQLCMNATMSQIAYYASPIATLYSSHCEQFNQNINSLSYGSANLAWESSTLIEKYSIMSCIVAIQGVKYRYMQEGKSSKELFKCLSKDQILVLRTFQECFGKNDDQLLIDDEHSIALDNKVQNICENILHPMISKFSTLI